MEVKPFGTRDIFRVVATLVITLVVGLFVAPRAQWVLFLAVGVLFYTLFLEFVKFYLGLTNLRKKKFYVATIRY